MGEATLGAILTAGTVAVPKAIAKLIDTVGDQIGLFLEPTHTRRQADAAAYASIAKAQAAEQVKVMKIGTKHVIQEIEDRAEQFRRNNSERQHRNAEAVTAEAAKALSGFADTVSETPVDPDWVAGFYGHCQDVSDEQMQTLWGKILAGEVVKPGSFSLRTLAAVKLLTKEDADLFTRFCSILWDFGGGHKVPIYPWEHWQDTSLAPVSRGEMELLDDLGLLRKHDAGTYEQKSYNGTFLLGYFGREYLILPSGKKIEEFVNAVEKQEPLQDFTLRTAPCVLTQVGQELATLAPSLPNDAYKDEVFQYYQIWKHEVVDYTEMMANVREESEAGLESPDARSPTLDPE